MPDREHKPAIEPVRYGDQPHQTLHPELAERMLRAMWREARPLFGHFLNQAMGVQPAAPTKAQRQGAPDRQGGE
jgi:hypothetical protein